MFENKVLKHQSRKYKAVSEKLLCNVHFCGHVLIRYKYLHVTIRNFFTGVNTRFPIKLMVMKTVAESQVFVPNRYKLAISGAIQINN